MEFRYGGKIYPVVLERKRVKNINLRVRTDGTIYVSAPPHVKEDVIQDFLEKHAERFAASSDRQKARNTPPDYGDGAVVRFLGEEIRLRWLEKPCRTILEHGVLTLFARTPEEAAYAFRQWYAGECVELCKKLNPEVCDAFRAAGYSVPLAKVEIKEMSSRWGSCTARSGRISINLRLMQYPEGCIRSVFYHEYTHFLYQNHGREFYTVLRRILPEYDRWDSILKERES